MSIADEWRQSSELLAAGRFALCPDQLTQTNGTHTRTHIDCVCADQWLCKLAAKLLVADAATQTCLDVAWKRRPEVARWQAD